MTADAIPAVPALRIEVVGDGDGGCVVLVRGELDTAAAGALQGALDDVLGRPGTRTCVVDLTGVTFLDCAGVHPLVQAHAAVRRSGRSLVVRTGTDPAVDRLLRLTGLGNLLTGPGGGAGG